MSQAQLLLISLTSCASCFAARVCARARRRGQPEGATKLARTDEMNVLVQEVCVEDGQNPVSHQELQCALGHFTGVFLARVHMVAGVLRGRVVNEIVRGVNEVRRDVQRRHFGVGD